MRTLSYFIVFACTISTSLPLAASVFERDLLTPGDGLLTFDDVNQREWLDLPYSFGIELANIQSQMNPGGVLENFKFATLEDIKPFALSAEVSWHATEGFQTPGLEAEHLIDLLGKVFILEVTNHNETGNDITISSFFSYGQIIQESIEDEPIFDDTNVTVLFLAGPVSGAVIASNFNASFGNITTDLPLGYEGLPQSTGDTGPFWLYRTVVPEPKSIFLLTIGTITTLMIRNRRR